MNDNVPEPRPNAPQVYAVIGDPVAHSRSPQMQNAAFSAAHIIAEYIPVHVRKEDLPAFVRHARKTLSGFNITVPHKNAIIPFLDSRSDEAAICESVNTVTISPDGHLHGDTTDGFGFEHALIDAQAPALKGSEITFIGCGGVVQALAFHCAAAGVARIHILNRTLDKAVALTRKMESAFPAIPCHASFIGDSSAVQHAMQSAQIIVQCTSLGLHEEDPAPVNPEFLPKTAFFFETVYKPTRLFSYCREHGIPTGNALDMLLHQGAQSWRIWTGREPDLNAMRDALRSI